VEWIESAIRFLTRGQTAGHRAIAVAQDVHSGEALVILFVRTRVSAVGGTDRRHRIADKIDTTRRMMAVALISIRSTPCGVSVACEGRELAAACVNRPLRSRYLTSVTIFMPSAPVQGSGRDYVVRRGGGAQDSAATHSDRVRNVVRASLAGTVYTPKPGHSSLSRRWLESLAATSTMAGARAATIGAATRRWSLKGDPSEARIAGPISSTTRGS
jgi:hypothetical protein